MGNGEWSPIPEKVKADVWDKTGGRCWYCGRFCNPYRGEFTVDHVVSASNGGSDDLDNLVPCCKSCNSRKRDRGVEWLRTFHTNGGIMFTEKQIAFIESNGGCMPDLEPHRFYFEEQGLGQGGE